MNPFAHHTWWSFKPVDLYTPAGDSSLPSTFSILVILPKLQTKHAASPWKSALSLRIVDAASTETYPPRTHPPRVLTHTSVGPFDAVTRAQKVTNDLPSPPSLE